MTRVFHIDGFLTTELVKTTDAIPLPNGLLIEPGTYSHSVYPGAWPMLQSGLYALCNFLSSIVPTAANFRIVSGDVHKVIVASMTLLQRGNYDLKTSAETIDQALDRDRRNMTYRSLGLLCGEACQLTQSIIAPLGVESRLVRCATAGVKTGYDDGHVLLEVKIDGLWRVYDIFNDRAWKLPNGDWANWGDVISGGLIPVQLARTGDFAFPYPSGQTSGFHALAWVLSTNLEEWTQRVFQIPGTDIGGMTYTYLPNPYGWSVLASREAWLAKCYP